MKRKLFYALVVISSYFTGVLVYLSYLSLVYHQGIGSEWGKFLFWTLPPYLFVVLPCYTLIFRLQWVSFWRRALLLVGASLFGVMCVFFMTGVFFLGLRGIFSPEFGLFVLFFAGSAFVFFYGSHVGSKGRGYMAFILGSIVIIFLAINMLAAEAEKSRPILHRIPQNFHGVVEIHYGDSNSPPISREKGYNVIRVPENGIYKTSSKRPIRRGTRYILVDEQGKDVRTIQIPGGSNRNGTRPEIEIYEYEVP